jgi:plastocyanin domain-containing protein
MKPTAIAVLVGAILIAGAIWYSGKSSSAAPVTDAHNVTVTDGKQIVEIGVKGGYSPKVSVAKAGMPTVLRMTTNATFDCSSALTIPSLGIRQMLPSSGDTDIEVPSQKAGTTLNGVCAMGMYHFAVNFN